MEAIIYQSQTGHTKEYAQLLSKQTGIPAYAVGDAFEFLRKGDSVIFMSWIKAGDVSSYGRIGRKYNIQALVVVGIDPVGARQIQRVQKRHRIGGIKVFYLRGGIDIKQIYGIERKMLHAMKDDLAKSFAKREKNGVAISDEEKDFLRLLTVGGSCVQEDNLAEIITWLEARES